VSLVTFYESEAPIQGEPTIIPGPPAWLAGVAAGQVPIIRPRLSSGSLGPHALDHFRRADSALRAALTAVRQRPIASRSAIQRHVIVVSGPQSRRHSPLFHVPFQPASRNLPIAAKAVLRKIKP